MEESYIDQRSASKARALLSIDDSIYNSDHSKASEQFVSDLKYALTEILIDTNDLIDQLNNIVYSIKTLTLTNVPAKLAIESQQQQKEETNAESEAEDFDGLKGIFYKAAIYFKAVDSIIDVLEFSSEPTADNANKLLRDYVHLTSMTQTGSSYSLAAIDILNQLYQEKYEEAGMLVLTTAGYALLPIIMGSFAPAFSAVMMTYIGYKTTINLHSFYSNYGSAESQLKSNIAYGKLFGDWGFEDKAKNYILNAMSIVEEDIKLNGKSSQIQYLAEELNLTGILYSFEIDCSYCNISE